MAYKITALQAIEQLIVAQSTFLLNTPGELELLLLEGFPGYQYIDPDELAEFYQRIFPRRTKGHVQIINSEDPSEVIGQYQKLIVRDLDPGVRKKNKLTLVKGNKVGA